MTTNPAEHLKELFHSSPRRSLKDSSYFQTYGDVLQKYQGRAVTMVEVGVHHGGSLFMWREFLGPQARIIGIDINPACRELEKDGFEIFLGQQDDPAFWQDFFVQVGRIDVLLDDGGHTSKCQLVTLFSVLPFIRNGGVIMVEDTLGSYLARYGNPSRYSFLNRCKQAVDDINARNPESGLKPTELSRAVYSMSFYPAIVVFHVDREKCLRAERALNEGQLIGQIETKDTKAGPVVHGVGSFLSHVPWLKRLALRVYFWAGDFRTGLKLRLENWSLRRYF